MPPHVELLGEQHDRRSFSCGVPALDRYLHQQAGQDAQRNLAVCYVLCESDGFGNAQASAPGSVPVLGYYTLSMTAIRPTALPEAAAKNLGRYETYPALLPGRLAVDQRYRGQRHGEFLLVDSMRRAVRLSTQAGAIALIVDALDEAAAGFYLRVGFVRFLDAHLRLYLSIAACRAALAASLTPDEMNGP